jgi:hypothetical protein
MYITSGGWAGKLFTPEDAWFVAYQNRTHNFCVVDVYENNTLRLQGKDIEGNTIDEVTIVKSPEITQGPVEETTTETEETESESDPDRVGGIPGFPTLAILTAIVIYYTYRKLMLE